MKDDCVGYACYALTFAAIFVFTLSAANLVGFSFEVLSACHGLLLCFALTALSIAEACSNWSS